ncbi:MAG: DUF433 domain-containing protein [Bacteroidetes bacterium]|nr:MAG: DUF433 domain-containing protein [Bacteroidota bacterium]TAG88221.1 MAG: DUF433 domain-containing protein [Bacteroidota bacterium]
MKLNKVLTVEAGKRQSKPCVRGMRIAYQDIIGWLESGMSVENILNDYPELNQRDISACIELAEDKESTDIIPENKDNNGQSVKKPA